MADREDLITVAQAAEELGLTPQAVRNAVMRGHITPERLDGRTSLLPRAEIDRYRRERLGRHGKRTLPDEALTEQQRRQRAYQRAYYQRHKATRHQQPATEPAESSDTPQDHHA